MKFIFALLILGGCMIEDEIHSLQRKKARCTKIKGQVVGLEAKILPSEIKDFVKECEDLGFWK